MVAIVSKPVNTNFKFIIDPPEKFFAPLYLYAVLGSVELRARYMPRRNSKASLRNSEASSCHSEP